eukprot:scaffold10716_cov113-Isochrysis_galbana.AAC.6
MLHLGRASDMDMHRLLADRHKFMVMALWGMEYTFQMTPLLEADSSFGVLFLGVNFLWALRPHVSLCTTDIWSSSARGLFARQPGPLYNPLAEAVRQTESAGQPRHHRNSLITSHWDVSAPGARVHSHQSHG